VLAGLPEMVRGLLLDGIWAGIGTVDIVAVAPGKIIPSGRTKTIQPFETGVVRAIHVRNGDQVQAGQLLVELDPTIATADQASASAQMLTSQLQAARNAPLAAYADGGKAKFIAPPGTPASLARSQEQFVAASVAEYEGRRASLLQRRSQHQADLAGAEAEIAKLERTLPLVDQQIAARQQLTDKGYFSKLKLLEYQQLRVEHVQNLAVQRANAAKAKAEIAEADADLLQLKGSFGRTAVSAQIEGLDKSRLAQGDVARSGRQLEYQALRAPVSGTVQQLAVSTIGGVVQPAQALMVIVPDDAPPAIEVHVLNRDIGFVRVGQKVRIKLEAYPFTEYGIVPGVVENISRDAIDLSQQGAGLRDEKGQSSQPGLVYAVRIKLERRMIRVGTIDKNLGPGLAVQAEIATGRRRIISYLLSPIAKALDESGKER